MKIIPIKNDYALTHNDAILYKTMPDLSTTLSSNSWYMIKLALDNNFAPQEWLGQSKAIGSGVYSDFEFRLIDRQPNRYEKVGGGYTKAVFELTSILTYPVVMNDDDINYGGWASSKLKEMLNTTILNSLPTELKNAISLCKVKSGEGGGSSIIIESNNKLFVPSEYEMTGTANYSLGSSEGSPQFDYYVEHNTDADRIKTVSSEVGGQIVHFPYMYWLRSPVKDGVSSSNSLFTYITQTGNSYMATANYGYVGVAPIFAL